MHFRELLQQHDLIGAHRGYRACYPENTRAAFAASLGRCHFIECDVQLCAEGTPVIIHDADLARTSNAALLATLLGQQSLQVDRWPLAALRQLDMAAWFAASDPFACLAAEKAAGMPPRSFAREQIMTLTELLSWAVEQHMPINVEIKDHHHSIHHQQAVPAVLAAIDATDSAGLVLISSFNHNYLRQCRQQRPELLLAALQDRQHPENLPQYLQELGVQAYHPSWNITDSTTVAALRAADLAVNVYTVNDRHHQQALFAMGVTAVITDMPCLTGQFEEQDHPENQKK